MHVSALLEFDVVPLDTDDEVTVLLDVTAPVREPATDRPPATLQIVLDRSGSMQGLRLDGAKQALIDLVARLDGRDAFGLVAFDHEASVEVPAGPLADKDRVRAQIEAVFARGSTDLSSGLLRGVQEARRASAGRGAALVVVSDGHANVGITDPVRLADIAVGAYAQGVTVTTLGYGLGYDERLMRAVATGGSGDALHAENPDTAAALLAAQAENVLAKTAQACSLIVRLSPPANRATVLSGPSAKPLGGGALMIELGDFYSGETRRLLLRLSVPGLAAIGPVTVATLEFTHVDPADLTSYTVAFPITVNVVPGDDAAGRIPNPTVRTELAYQEAQQAKLDASESLRRGDRQASHHRLLEAHDLLKARLAEAPPEMAAEIRREIAHLFGLSQSSLLRDPNQLAKEAMSDGDLSSRKRRIHRDPPLEDE